MSSSSVTPQPWRLPLIVFVSVLALCTAVLAVRMLAADVKAVQARMFLDDWSEKRGLGSERAWQVAKTAAESANRYNPVENGTYLERLGLIHEWRNYTLPFGAAEAQPDRELALKAYRQAIESRPLWPYDWVKLAFIKLRLLEFDEEFHQALAQGYSLGPDRARVIGPLTEVGLIAWPQLDRDEQARLWRGLAMLFQYDARRAKRLMPLVEKAGLQSEMCRQIDLELLQRRGQCRQQG